MNSKIINIDPETLGGTPVFNGTRVPIQSLFDYIEGGETLDEFLENFPTVTKEQAIAVLNLAERFVTSEKILNENLQKKLKIELKPNDVHTVQDMNRKGKKNGELLGLMTLSGFEVFITVDINLKYQQNLDKFPIIVFLLNSPNSKHKILQDYVPKVQEIMNYGIDQKYYEINL